jgi:hypothetical protein
MLEEQPKQITVAKVECVLMPNGEVILLGKTIGWFQDLKAHLEVVNKP